MDPLFKPLPESLAGLSVEDIDSQISEITATFAAVKANDPEVLGDRTAEQILAEVAAGKEAYAALKAQKTAIADAEASYGSSLDELFADVEELSASTDEEPEGDPSDPEPETPETPEAEAETPVEAEAELEPVVAAATPPAPRRPLPSVGRHAPRIAENTDPRAVHLTASAGMAEFQPGQALDRDSQALALGLALDRTSVPQGGYSKVIVAHGDFTSRVPEDRRLNDEMGSDQRKIDLARDPVNLVAAASGPYCAPLTPYYTLMDISVADRPVRDALNGFVATRGGVTYQPPPALSAATGVGDVTSTQAGEGGTFATKVCQVIVCPAINSVQVDSIYGCITFGNLQSRSNPELIAHYNSLVRDAHARLAETKLLDQIKAGSTKVTGGIVNGAVNTLLGHYLELAAGIRSANRMAADARLRILAPNWVRDQLVLDIVRSQFERFAYTQDGVEALLDRFNLNASFYLDGSSDGGQVYSVQGAGAITAFPTTVETAMFPEGGWMFLDAGTLDLGVYRDSVLNAQNQAQMFFETFEAAALMSPVSYWITSTLCANGAVAAPSTAITC